MRGEERADEKGWGQEGGRIIDGLIEKETDKGGGRRLRSARNESGVEIK